MSPDLPSAIARYFSADRKADPKKVADCFTPDAVVIDEGRTHTGLAAIHDWTAAASTQYSYTVEPIALAREGMRWIVTGHLEGTFPGSPIDLRYAFMLEGDRIAKLEIAP